MKIKIRNFFSNVNWKFLICFIVVSVIFVLIPFIIVIVSSFITTPETTIADNWDFIDGYFWQKIFLSIGVSLAVVCLTFIIGFPFGYFLSKTNSKVLKVVNLMLITAPLWLSTLIKLIGLKTIFDLMAGQPQGTYGNIYTIIALTYNSLPVFILLIYNIMEVFPVNLLRASKDLGRNNFDTFRYVILPYTAPAVLSGLFITFVSCLCTSGVSSFVNNSNDGDLIGSVIFDLGKEASESQIALSRVSSLSLVLCSVIVVLFLVTFYIPKKIKLYLKTKRTKNENSNKQK